MTGVGVGGGDAGRQVAWELLVDLVTGVIPAAEQRQIYDGELSTELYRLRDALNAAVPILGVRCAGLAGMVERAASLLRDEFDRGQALRLLRLAADQLADVADVGVPMPRPPRA